MIPELGHFALILAFFTALVQAVVPLVGTARGLPAWSAVARPAAMAQLLFVAIAYAALSYSFITNDFSVAYVATNSNVELPFVYRLSGVWGAHEGSLLLWSLILALWTAAVCLYTRSLPTVFVTRVIAVMGLISIGFLAFMLFTSNPFTRLLPAPLAGRDLNPLLQDPGLALHPPMLYLGYVGFVVPFAFAVAALIGGRFDAVVARWARPWTLVAWLFLTLGISLGSWWAYYELGWGGWWFWDPVENSSFLPWLVGTALIHSLAATENRGVFKAWTVLLAVFTFSLSLLGMFLVRSGVLTSVHAFTTDPARGVFILTFLGLVVGGSLWLYAWRAPRIRSMGGFEFVSRESGLLLNNALLTVAMATVLLGTLYPLVLDALGLGKVSVGPPYFNSVFVPIMVPLALLIGVGALVRWKRDRLKTLLWRLRGPGVVAVVAGLALPALVFPRFDWAAALGIGLATWVTLTAAYGVWSRVVASGGGLRGLAKLPRAFWGMTLAHFAIGLLAVGIALTTSYEKEKDLALKPGESYSLGGYDFRFEGVRPVDGPNYQASEGRIVVSRAGQEPIVLRPQKRLYRKQEKPLTEEIGRAHV